MSLLGGWWLLVLVLQSACAVPRNSLAMGSRHESAVDFVAPGSVTTGPVRVLEAEFKQSVQRLTHDVWLGMRTPQEAARELLNVSRQPPRDIEAVASRGDWTLELYAERGYTLVPEHQKGPVSLVPKADDLLRKQYLQWCERRGGGDCLGLLDDGPYLRTDDRRTLALALAFGSVLDETRAALGREVNARALVSMVVWTVALYCMMWMVPEPTTKAVAATLTVMLMGWLGLRTVYGLMDGWARMATAAHEGSTFEELREAGEEYGKLLGEDAARAMILAVATLIGRTLGEVAASVKTLPGHGLAEAQWVAQGGAAALAPELAAETAQVGEGALAQAMAAVETVATSPQGPLAVVMLKKRSGGGVEKAPGGRTCEIAIRHRGGNRQVELSDGQRWHLPRGKSLADIPAEDPAGEHLQRAVSEAASRWSPKDLSDNEVAAIANAEKQGEYWLARLLEREARGRFVQNQVRAQFEPLDEFSLGKGVDVVDPSTGLQYEILSGTESNMARHGRRMASEFFRMLTF